MVSSEKVSGSMVWWTHGGVVQIGQGASFGVFLKSASRLLPDGWVELKMFGCRWYFRAFQPGLDIRSTKNFEIGSVVTKLQPSGLGRILENPAILRCSDLSESYGGGMYQSAVQTPKIKM